MKRRHFPKCPTCNGMVGIGAGRFRRDMRGATIWNECPNCGPVDTVAVGRPPKAGALAWLRARLRTYASCLSL